MKQILIVEDDSFLNKMLAYNLTADGYGVTSALNARTAAEAIRQREFDLVLLDINLPDGNGFELCKLIKPQHPDTIVIFLTANDQESDQIRGYEVGAVDYITKPFVIGALQRKIKAMFAMLEHHKPAKDIYDDGRLFLDFSEQTASLNGKPLTLSPMEYKMLNLCRKNITFPSSKWNVSYTNPNRQPREKSVQPGRIKLYFDIAGRRYGWKNWIV